MVPGTNLGGARDQVFKLEWEKGANGKNGLGPGTIATILFRATIFVFIGSFSISQYLFIV